MNFVYFKKCNVCDSKNIKITLSYKSHKLNVFLKKYYKFKNLNILNEYSLEIFKCKSCNHIFQGKVLNKKKIFFFYNNIINVREKYLKKVNKTKKNISIAEKISEKLKKNIKVLDFGSGYTSYYKKNKNLNFYTFDISKIKNSNNISKISDLTKYKFDLIIANQVFEHLKYPKITLDIFNKILNKNGYIKLELPSSFFIFFKFFLLKIIGPKKIILNDFFPIEHINSFTNKSIDKLTSRFNREDFDSFFWLENKKNFKNILKYLSIKFLFFRIFFSLLILKNGGHYLILKKK
jgi:2-polyprenyl-3-methyl-5-hydroxy-6-metoxy-1,4-benzoquinol methylase